MIIQALAPASAQDYRVLRVEYIKCQLYVIVLKYRYTIHTVPAQLNPTAIVSHLIVYPFPLCYSGWIIVVSADIFCTHCYYHTLSVDLLQIGLSKYYASTRPS